MKIQRFVHRVTAMLCAVILCLTCAGPVSAAATSTTSPAASTTSETAALIRLLKTEGTVSAFNASRKNLTLSDNMRLYNGNSVQTAEKSYAWVSLDSTKAAKLDAASEAEIRKNGKKLEILAKSGNLFFNVEKPLESDETLNIRTSTMMTGIRGTSGWVKVLTQTHTRLYLLEGTVQCVVTDPVSGQVRTLTLHGGDMVDCYVYQDSRPVRHALPSGTGTPDGQTTSPTGQNPTGQNPAGQNPNGQTTSPDAQNPDAADDRSPAADGSMCEIVRARFGRRDIDGFVLRELLDHPDLREKIREETGMDLSDLTEEEVADRLDEDQRALAEELEQIADAEAAQNHNISTDPVWAPSRGGGGGGGSRNSSSTPSQTIDLTMPVTAQEVQNYLDQSSVRQVNLHPGTENNPETPDTPENPEDPEPVPDTPENPDTPEPVPDMPENPENPEPVPDTPENPEAPEPVPDTPENPEDPEPVPDTPENPGEPVDNTLHVDIAMRIPSGKTLYALEGVSADVWEEYAVTVDGTLTVAGDLTNAGTLTVNSANTLTVQGAFVNTESGVVSVTESGRVVCESLDTSGTFRNAGRFEGTMLISDGSFTLTRGEIIAAPDDETAVVTISGGITDSVETLPDITLSGGQITNDAAGPALVLDPEASWALDEEMDWFPDIPDGILRSRSDIPALDAHGEIPTGYSVRKSVDGVYYELIKESTGPEARHIFITEGVNGVVSADRDIAFPDDTVQLTVTPDEGYEIDTLNIQTDTQTPEDIEYIDMTPEELETDTRIYTFLMPDSDVTVSAEFREKFPEESDGLYAILYTDGELVFQNGEPSDDGEREMMYNWPLDFTEEDFFAPWVEMGEWIETVTFLTSIKPRQTDWWFSNCRQLTKINHLDYLDMSDVSDMSYMFSGCSALTELDLSTWNTSNVTDMSGLFEGCTNLRTIYVSELFSTVNAAESEDPDTVFIDCENLTGGAGTKYDGEMTGLEYARIDGGDEMPGYFTARDTQTSPEQPVEPIVPDEPGPVVPDEPEPVVPGGYRNLHRDNAAEIIRMSNPADDAENVVEDTFTGYTDVPFTGYTDVPFAGYTDVSPDAWYASAVAYCREKGLMLGTSETTFSPAQNMTRAMAVTVLYRLTGSPEVSGTDDMTFEDVPAWCRQAVAWAVRTGVVTGYSPVRFGPNDPVTRQQLAAFLWRYAGRAPVDSAENTAAFTDEAWISSYALEAVRWAKAAGAIQGYSDGSFYPGGTATRAHMARILMNYADSPAATVTPSALSELDVLCAPGAIVTGTDGALLVTDTYSKVVWSVSDGASSLYAGGDSVRGLYGEPTGGYHDALRTDSYFRTPWAMTRFLNGWAVSDAENNALRLILPDGIQTINPGGVSTTAAGTLFDYPTGLASDDAGNLYVSDTHNGTIRRINTQGDMTLVVSGLDAPMGLYWYAGSLYAVETGANQIIRVTDGRVSVIAGAGSDGFSDGPALTAEFSSPQALTVAPDGTIYVSDTANSAVRQIRGGMVRTILSHDWEKMEFSPISPAGLLVRDNMLYICDNFSRKVFRLPLSGN